MHKLAHQRSHAPCMCKANAPPGTASFLANIPNIASTSIRPPERPRARAPSPMHKMLLRAPRRGHRSAKERAHSHGPLWLVCGRQCGVVILALLAGHAVPVARRGWATIVCLPDNALWVFAGASSASPLSRLTWRLRSAVLATSLEEGTCHVNHDKGLQSAFLNFAYFHTLRTVLNAGVSADQASPKCAMRVDRFVNLLEAITQAKPQQEQNAGRKREARKAPDPETAVGKRMERTSLRTKSRHTTKADDPNKTVQPHLQAQPCPGSASTCTTVQGNGARCNTHMQQSRKSQCVMRASPQW